MISITYGVVKAIYSYNGATRESYGLVAYANAETDGTATIAASAYDLCCDETKVQNLANKCNAENLSLDHFNDIVEDFIVEENSITNTGN